MKKIVFAIFCGWALWTAFGAVGVHALPASPMVAEQNGDQKRRYVVTVEGTNCWARLADATGASRPCEPLPVLPPAGATLEPIGDQHLVLKDAAGAPILYYHLVTDRWVSAE